MGLFRKVLRVLGAAALLVLHFGLGGVAFAAVKALHWWALPGLFGFEMMVVGAVFVLLIPPSKKLAFSEWAPWLRNMVSPDSKRMQNAFWQRVRQAGPFALAFAAMMLGGGLFAGVMLRFLAVSEQRAWSIAFFTAIIASVLKIFLYLGLWGAIAAALHMVS